MELAQATGDRGLPPASGRIEMADLSERVRKLEAIAAGIDILVPRERTSSPGALPERRSGFLPGPPLSFAKPGEIA